MSELAKIRHVAFLRGINVGGHKIIKMDWLSTQFSAMGFSRVKTLLASGNVLFESDPSDTLSLIHQIETTLLAQLGYRVQIVLRTREELKTLIELNPFNSIQDLEAKCNVTFFNQAPSSKIDMPYRSELGDFELLRIHQAEILSVSYRSPSGSFGSPVLHIEKTWKDLSTTRNWNTVKKALALCND